MKLKDDQAGIEKRQAIVCQLIETYSTRGAIVRQITAIAKVSRRTAYNDLQKFCANFNETGRNSL
jgi:hypothetical protein